MNVWWISTLFLLWTITFVDGKIKIRHGDNPGSCGKKNVNEIILVRARQNRQKILICTEEKGVYAWRTTDNSRASGEFFSPGYDCSTILDENPKAKDGFYWINYGDTSPIKVWCDMNTDGGGFMLIGRKKSAITWAVPSNNNLVKPFGSPHWSSALGEAPVLDFRVQMATAEDFKKTKAHWFYRFQNKRKLKNLIINRAGCNRNSPGIGDVAYVKDLQKDDIVTTKFRCSKFGTGHHPQSMLGWSKMNWCLQKPCPRGFAFHRNSPNQTDYSGGFSYSTERTTSGNGDDATAFVGCDYSKCCGCYGPKGGKKDYCLKQCQSKNGGTIITKKVFTWFWVRSTHPKRLWSECMEYNVTKNGVVVWYKLVRGGALPVRGRCAKNEALLYDGIVVAPDNVTAKGVPSVDGLIMYRKDKKELYVTENKKWNVIAQEKKILGILEKRIGLLDKKLNKTLSGALQNLIEKSSLTLDGKPGYLKQLKAWLPSGKSWYLCYRATRDGWQSSVFHLRCDGQAPTITIIRVGSYIFGGYSDKAWSSSSGYTSSSYSFIFSLRNKYNSKPFKTTIYRYRQYAIYNNRGYGPTFGGGHDIYIANNAHTSTSSYSNLGYTYRPPSGYSYGNSNTRGFLAGSYYFKPSEVEVFYLR